MIQIRTSRQFLESAVIAFFPFIDMLKQTKINNVITRDAGSDEYLSIVALNCIIGEIQDKIRKKLVNTKSQDLRIDFTDAQGVVFYKTLQNIPLDNEKPFHVGIVTNWLQQLDGQLITAKIYQENRIASIDARTDVYDYYEE